MAGWGAIRPGIGTIFGFRCLRPIRMCLVRLWVGWFGQGVLKKRGSAAGLVILREAGGFVEAIEPEGDVLDDGALIAANEALFEKFAKIIRNR